jgi:anti-sigma factor RsiW
MDDDVLIGPADLTCAEAVELMTEYLEGGLDEAARERFEQHLALCEGCDNHLDQLGHTIATSRRIAANELPEHLRSSLQRAFRGWKDGA